MHNKLSTINTNSLIDLLPPFSSPPTQAVPSRAPTNLLQHILTSSNSIYHQQTPFDSNYKRRYVHKHITITCHTTGLKKYHNIRYRLAPPGLEIPEGQLLIYAHDDNWPAQATREEYHRYNQDGNDYKSDNLLIPPKKQAAVSVYNRAISENVSESVFFEHKILFPDYDVDKLKTSWECVRCWRDFDYPSSSADGDHVVQKNYNNGRMRIEDSPVYNDAGDKLCGECVARDSSGWSEYQSFRKFRCEQYDDCGIVDSDDIDEEGVASVQQVDDNSLDDNCDRSSTISVIAEDDCSADCNTSIDSNSDSEIDGASSVASLSTCQSSWHDYEGSIRSLSTTPLISSTPSSLGGLVRDVLSFQGHDDFR